jgi:hypothetical protein
MRRASILKNVNVSVRPPATAFFWIHDSPCRWSGGLHLVSHRQYGGSGYIRRTAVTGFNALQVVAGGAVGNLLDTKTGG